MGIAFETEPSLSVRTVHGADDHLSALLERFPLRAGVFHTGEVCGSFNFERGVKPGHFHLMRSGSTRLIDAGHGEHRIDEPSVVFMPNADSHKLESEEGVDLVCATVYFGVGGASPVVGALPALTVVKLRDSSQLASLAALIGDEVTSAMPGRQAALNRLCELAVVAVLRTCLEAGRASGGALAGLADAQLARALVAMHARPEREWSLDELASLAGMSRARFAARFRDAVCATPGEHLAACRIARAQQLLREGARLKTVAETVGYASASALTRAFTRIVGTAPTRWRGSKAGDHSPS